MIVVAPFSVDSKTASITALVPLAKFSNSKTPTGLRKMIVSDKSVDNEINSSYPFQTITLACSIGFFMFEIEIGP